MLLRGVGPAHQESQRAGRRGAACKWDLTFGYQEALKSVEFFSFPFHLRELVFGLLFVVDVDFSWTLRGLHGCLKHIGVILRTAFSASRRTYVLAGSVSGTDNVHRSFIGSPRQSRELRFLRMTIGGD